MAGDQTLRARREARAARTRGGDGHGTGGGTGGTRDGPGGGTGDGRDGGALDGRGEHGTPADQTEGPATGLVPDELRRRTRPHSPPAPPHRIPLVADRDTGSQAAEPQRTVHDAEHGRTLPGRRLRGEGEPAAADESVNEAYDGLGGTWRMLLDAFGRNSLDGVGLPLVGSVHYAEEFDNAYWDGEQMVFGDGDGEYFNSFTDCLDVIGHELAHGVTQFTAGLVYLAQAGALNESISDVFGSLVKQWSRGESAEQADWLIGAGLFTGRVHGQALRSMKAPGTAYDDPVLGKDPQPSDMDGYQDLPHDDRNDNGGVHINSGIPNRAFYLAATGIGGTAWEGAGLVWYDVLTGGTLAKDADFATFAAATIAAAERRFVNDEAKVEAVRAAWAEVKVPVAAPSLRSR